MIDLQDEDGVQTIRDFVRNNPDIEVYDYIRRGCNGEVYFGKRKKLNDDVVLKFYWSYPNYDETEEAVILRKIKHKNILEVYDLRFLAPNYAFFLTPKISGGDLQGMMDKSKFSTKSALEIISGILLGLTELHSVHKLVHRDLKPGNILIDLTDYHPIIADLGAVKKLDDAKGHVTASKSTYLYLPPEAVIRNEYYYQSDIYQVGIIMFQLLNGFFPINEPYKWLSNRELAKINALKNSTDKHWKFEEVIGNKIAKGRLIDPNSLPYYLDSSFKRVLNKAIHPDYKSRYKNSSLFLKEIHQLLRNYPDYIEDQEKLFVNHENGTQFQIYKNKKQEIILEKRIFKRAWRKDNNHNGTIDSALKIAKLSKNI